MKKILSLILLAVMSVCCLASCGNTAADTSSTEQTDLDYITAKGKLIVGITDFEPMDYIPDGETEWTGFDAELARLVGEKLGVTVEFQEVNWEKKETELASKTVDCIWNGLTWSEDRAQNMSMTDYYMLNRQVIVVKAENAEKYNTLDALKSASIAAESGSAGEEYITKALADATYIEKDGQKDVLTELLAGTVDAGVLDYTMAYYLINKEGSDFAGLKILEGVAEVEDEYYAIAFRKGSNVTAKVNEILKTMKSDGTVDKLAAKYGLADAIVK